MLKSNHYFYWAAGFIAVISLVHIGLSQQIGFGVDEAHYALYGLKPALSYFDHPPLMGWLVVMLNALVELNEFSLRFLTTLIMAINSLLLYVLARKVAPNIAHSGFVSVVLFNLGIMVQLLGWSMVPDVPLMTYFLLLALLIPNLNKTPNIWAWVALGVLMGLSALSKYTAIAAPVALGIFAFKQGYLWGWLKQFGLWLAVFIALVLISPILIWNAEHDWASFIYQINHGSEGQWQITNLLKTLASHLLLYSPLLFVAGFFGLFLSSADSPIEQFVRLVFYCYLAMVGWAAGNGELLPHWGVVAYLFLAPIAAKHIGFFIKGAWQRTLGAFLAAISLALFLTVYVLVGLRPVGFDIEKAYYDAMGWEQAGIEAKKLAQDHKVEQLLVHNWTHASRIAWYSKLSPIRVIGSKPNQYDIWYGRPVFDKRSLLVLPTDLNREFSFPQSLPAQFTCQLLKEEPFIFKNKQIVSFRYYLCNRPSM